jgi:hypothetical protein
MVLRPNRTLTENTSLQFGSLESLSLLGCRDRDFETEVEYSSMYLTQRSTQTYAECCELLAPIIPKFMFYSIRDSKH